MVMMMSKTLHWIFYTSYFNCMQSFIIRYLCALENGSISFARSTCIQMYTGTILLFYFFPHTSDFSLVVAEDNRKRALVVANDDYFRIGRLCNLFSCLDSFPLQKAGRNTF